jgi:hypothetical protein
MAIRRAGKPEHAVARLGLFVAHRVACPRLSMHRAILRRVAADLAPSEDCQGHSA